MGFLKRLTRNRTIALAGGGFLKEGPGGVKPVTLDELGNDEYIVLASSEDKTCVIGAPKQAPGFLWSLYTTRLISVARKKHINDFFIAPLHSEAFQLWKAHHPAMPEDEQIVSFALSPEAADAFVEARMNRIAVPFTLIFSKAALLPLDDKAEYRFSMGLTEELHTYITDIVHAHTNIERSRIFVSKQIISLPQMYDHAWTLCQAQALDWFSEGQQYTRHEFDQQVVSFKKDGPGWTFFGIPLFVSYELPGNHLNSADFDKFFKRIVGEVPALNTLDALQNFWQKIAIDAKPLRPSGIYSPYASVMALKHELDIIVKSKKFNPFDAK